MNRLTGWEMGGNLRIKVGCYSAEITPKTAAQLARDRASFWTKWALGDPGMRAN